MSYNIYNKIQKKIIVIFSVFILFFLINISITNAVESGGLSSVAASNWLNTAISGHSPQMNNSAKERALASISGAMKQEVVQKVNKSTIDWVNNGFDGKPAYMTDPYSVLRTTTEKVVEDVVYGDYSLKHISPDFELPLKFAINDYYFGQKPGELSYQPVSTVNKYEDDEVFSWSKFLDMGTNPANSLFSNYYNLIDDIDRVVGERGSNLQEEIDRGKGYLSLRQCEDGWEYDGSSEAAKHCKIVTPGYTIAEQVNKAISSDVDRVIFANEVDELMGVLVDGLLSKTLSSGGLASISDPDYSNMGVKSEIFLSEKNRLLLQFDSRAYDIAVKILESQKRTLENVKSHVQGTLSCWGDKETKKENGSSFYRNSAGSLEDPRYEILVSGTIEKHVETVGAFDSFTEIQKDINNIDRKILDLFVEKSKIGDIQIAITDAKEYAELYDIVNYSNLGIINLMDFKNEKKDLEAKYNSIINGKIIGYTGNIPIKMGGVNASGVYCQSFDLEGRPSGTIENSSEEFDVFNKNDAVFIDGYDSRNDIWNLNNGGNISTEYDDSYFSYDGHGVSYKNLISVKTPSKAGIEDIISIKDFFEKEVKTKLSGGKNYLAFLKKSIIGSYDNYDFNSFLVDKKVSYQEGLGDKIIDKISGAERYCTTNGWSRYKVYLPPTAKKIALLFRPERDILHRIHLTYNPINNINHKGVKTLSYENEALDLDHSDLTDLFENSETVLLNAKYQGPFLSDKEVGVSVAGLVLGEAEIKKYIKNNGGWLYIDIAQDLNAAGEKVFDKDNKVKIFYYVDVDRENTQYLEWVNNMDQFIKDVNVDVVEEECL